MKRETTDEIIALIDDAFIEEAMPTEDCKKKKPNFGRILALAAGFLIAIGIGAGSVAWQNRPLPDLSGRYETKYVSRKSGDGAFIQTAGAVEAYMSIDYGNGSYKSSGSVSGEYLSEMLKFAELEDGSARLEIYKLNDISQKYAIAIRSGRDKFDVLLNTLYLPGTVGEWKENIAFEKTAKITSVCYTFADRDGTSRTVEFENADESLIYSAIFGDGKAKITPCFTEPEDICITVVMSIPSLGTDDFAVYISSSGDVYSKMPWRAGTYRISRNAVRSLIDYLAENCEGKELIYK